MDMAGRVKTIDAFPSGIVRVPPSKSLSHRALICAALAAACGTGESCLKNLGESRDVAATAACMQKLVLGEEVLACDESGSTLRFLLPLAALSGRQHTFTGKGRLLQRPLGAYAKVFGAAGVAFETGAAGIQVRGPFKSGHYRLAGDVSSQFITGLLLALPLAAGDSLLTLTSALESRGYVEMTLEVMARFGVYAEWDGGLVFNIPGGQRYKAAAYTVEGDYSQAAFFLAAAALGRPVRCVGLAQNSSQGDAAIVRLLERMGTPVVFENGEARVVPARGEALTADMRDIPDLAPALAALGCFLNGRSLLVNAGRLRLKESDRLTALATQLHGLGATIKEGPSSLAITGLPLLAGGAADACGDHRIAMAMAVAAIGCEKPVRLTGWEHVSKSYPDFWRDFETEAAYG